VRPGNGDPRAIGHRIGLQLNRTPILGTQGTVVGPHEGIRTPSELRLYPTPAFGPKTFVARSHTRNRATQASDLRKCGAPKGIRIPIVLVTIGTTWDSLVLKSCGESQ